LHHLRFEVENLGEQIAFGEVKDGLSQGCERSLIKYLERGLPEAQPTA
jgi:hypothetical protein